MTHIKWIEESDAQGDVADAYNEYFRRRPNREKVADILKCFSHRPDFLMRVMQFSWELHFCDGHLTERVKEMIATLVSGQNRCSYCMHSHAWFLHEQGVHDQAVSAIGRGDIDGAPITEAERALLRFAQLVTNASYRTTAEDTQKLRDAGWSDPQIAEAVYITAMFAFFNRVANAFGLQDQKYFELAGAADPLADFLSSE
ncbi:MAG: carboxymuconolactone decarboxylase family protein [Pirellulales bacterium]